MSLEVDEPLDSESLDCLIGSTFESTPSETQDARDAVTFAYLGRRGGDGGGGNVSSFPGPNPISMDPEHLEIVKKEEYVVSAKTDGTRYQIVARGDKVILMDRTMRCLTTTYSALPPICFADEGSVFDAELVMVGKQRSILYVFDVVMIGGMRQVASLQYTERMSIVTEFGAGMEVGFGSHVLVEILPKPIFPKRKAYEVMTDPASVGILGSTDGVVLTPVRLPVQIRTHWTMFKVKLHHTLDFRLVLVPHKFGAREQQTANNTSAIPTAIAEKMRNQILKHALSGTSSSSSSTTTTESKAAGGSKAAGAGAGAGGSKVGSAAGNGGGVKRINGLLAMVGKRKDGPVPAPPPAALLPPTPASASASSSSSSSVSGGAPPPRMQWIPRLEFGNGTTMPDATTHGIEYGGFVIILRIADDPTFNALLDKIEEVYRTIDGQVVSLSVIVECNLQITQEHFGPASKFVLPVKIERTRPDKHEPNSYLTITRTITSILKGVTPKHLLSLVD